MYDVIIAGSGLAGSLLGSILARHEAKVLLIDAGRHPKFAIGESTVRDTTKMLAVLADAFDVPEIQSLSGYLEVDHKVSRRCGLKRNFGFTYHEEGQSQDPDQIYQVVIPDAFDGPEAHYLRSDIDHYVAKVARKYGAQLLEETRIADIAFHDRCVEVVTTAGERFEARYIVDGTGFRSILANQFDLREKPTRFKTCSRSVFTHMTGVQRYEDVAPDTMARVPRRWSQGTLHHCFDGGWLWVIPFNNGPDGDAHNAHISVGLQLDPRKYPFDEAVPPEQEFQALLDRYPSLQRQFADAVPIREWTTTGPRMQYSSKRTIGDRFCLSSHAAGFLDPIYSRGLALTTSSLLCLADELIQAIADDDFSTARFEGYDQLVQRSLDRIDDLVSGSYTAWRNFDLWNAWVRVWYASVNLSTLHISATHKRFQASASREQLLREMYHPRVGSYCPPIDAFQDFFASAVRVIDAVQDGDTSPEAATDEIFALLRGAECIPPVFELANPSTRFGGKFDAAHWHELMRWGNFDAPGQVKDQLFAGDPQSNLDAFTAKYERFFTIPEIAEIRPFLDRTLGGAA